MEENENFNKPDQANDGAKETRDEFDPSEAVTEQHEPYDFETVGDETSDGTETMGVDEDFGDEDADYVAARDDGRSTRSGISIPAAIALVAASTLLGALATAFAVPYLYGSSPQDVYGGKPEIEGVLPAESTAVIQSGPTKIVTVKNSASNPVAAVAQKLEASVVNIRVQQVSNPLSHPTFVSGAGSGVIFSSDGYILTNNHVISGSSRIFVTIGTEEVEAKLVAADTDTDLAVIKVNKTGLRPAEFGSTKDIQVGDLTVAMGSPFGFEHTVTSGIVSALNRTVSVPNGNTGEQATYINLIQTDASINPGNSGGALSNAEGEVIGINALIVSSSGASEGVGFAIPSEIAQSVAKQLITGGRASHAYIGITGHDVSDVFAGGVNSVSEYGAEVVDVVAGGPAAEAGLKQQDVIVSINDQKISDMNELIAAVRQNQVGDKVKVTFYRGKEKKTVELKLAEKPAATKE